MVERRGRRRKEGHTRERDKGEGGEVRAICWKCRPGKSQPIGLH